MENKMSEILLYTAYLFGVEAFAVHIHYCPLFLIQFQTTKKFELEITNPMPSGHGTSKICLMNKENKLMALFV